MNSKFIVIEGLEGAGKTSVIMKIADFLQKKGISDIVLTRDPGGTPLAETLRTLIKYSIEDEPITKYAELFMLYAARAQLVERVIKPALIRGAWVVSDRHDLSSQAYQGGGRNIDKNLLKKLHNLVLGDCIPDLTFYLDIKPTIGLSRTSTRGKPDRIEKESLEFFNRARARYQELAAKDDRIIVIDASKPRNTVDNEIYYQMTQWLKTQMEVNNEVVSMVK